jgi:hypothetical protein
MNHAHKCRLMESQIHAAVVSLEYARAVLEDYHAPREGDPVRTAQALLGHIQAAGRAVANLVLIMTGDDSDVAPSLE